MNNINQFFQIIKVIGETIYFFWWIIFPITFYYIFKIIWIDFVAIYSSHSWYNSQKWSLLEIIPPREIEKGPQMMENIFIGLTGVLTTFDTFSEYITGAWYHDRFSVELIGAEGKIHFYIRTQKKYRNMLRSHIYAQYPDAQILEVEDYVENFPKVLPSKHWDMWGTDFEFVANDAIPIKTYDKFEENVTGEMIDPMAALTEALGSLAPGQHLWLQFVLQPLPEPRKKDLEGIVKELKGEKKELSNGIAQDLLEVLNLKNILKGLFTKMEFQGTENDILQPLEFRLSPIEKERLKATEENLGRNLFSTKMRMIYLGRKENFDKSNMSAFIGAIKQFNDLNLNQVKPEDISKTYANIFFTKGRLAIRKRKLYDRYKKRNMDGKKIIFSTKELATVFHFPDMGVKTPAIQRVDSKLGSAPGNLPIR